VLAKLECQIFAELEPLFRLRKTCSPKSRHFVYQDAEPSGCTHTHTLSLSFTLALNHCLHCFTASSLILSHTLILTLSRTLTLSIEEVVDSHSFTHTHCTLTPHSLTVPLSLSHSHSLIHSLTDPHSLSLSLSLCRCLLLPHRLFSHSLTLSFIHSHSLSLFLPLGLTITPSFSLILTASLTHSLPLIKLASACSRNLGGGGEM
jgi:hypothetical protein